MEKKKCIVLWPPTSAKDILFLIPGTCECLWIKRVFVDVIRLRNLRWADYPGLRRRALNTNTITNILTRGEQREIWPQMEDRRQSDHRRWPERDEATSCGKPAVTGGWKQQGKHSPPGLPRGTGTWPTPWLWLSEMDSELQASRSVRE